MVELARFKNRAHAGKLLADPLAPFAHARDAIVLALPRGGVPVGFALAMALDLPLDLLIVRKLGLPSQPEYAIGAVGSGGVQVLQHRPGFMGMTQEQLDAVLARELAELARRERLYRGERAEPVLARRRVLLVDDGIATGATMLAAIQVARLRGAAQVIVAVPVAPPETLETLTPQVDELVCLVAPPRFYAVGQWYDRFDQTSDEEVQELLAMAWRSRDEGQCEPQPNRKEST